MIDLEKFLEDYGYDIENKSAVRIDSEHVQCLLDHIAQLEKDAGRYQWLKNKGRYCDWRVEQENNGWMTTHSASTLDQAIDTAMESNHG